MDRYWNYIGTPLFFIVIGFGIVTLFSVHDIQLVGDIDKEIAAMMPGKQPSIKPPSSVANAAAPAKP